MARTAGRGVWHDRPHHHRRPLRRGVAAADCPVHGRPHPAPRHAGAAGAAAAGGVMLTYAELFAGAGGLSMGLETAGFHAVAHAEIEPHARAVLRYRWPDTRLDGDVTKIDGRDYAGVTLLSGGSPCQDLSVAGKRAGLGGARSSLFYEQVRIWNESGAPYLLWENVGGALSSNH
ncbi:MAG: DNA cytosine methyltransferase, partial [bacterium]